MSAEKINPEKVSLEPSIPLEMRKKNISGRVDINHLLAKVREEQKKENHTNLVFFGFFASLIVIVGILLSL